MGENNVEEYRDRIITMEQIIIDIAKKVQEHRIVLFGNGKPGMKYEFVQLKDALKYNNIVTTLLMIGVVGNLVKVIFFG